MLSFLFFLKISGLESERAIGSSQICTRVMIYRYLFEEKKLLALNILYLKIYTICAYDKLQLNEPFSRQLSKLYYE